MPTTELVPIRNLALDLRNFRTLPQADENKAVSAMVAVNPDWFWALTESLLDDGYHATENILVLQQGKKKIVREGNRRIAALKLIHGLLPTKDLPVPSKVLVRINELDKSWKAQNDKVPCAVYGEKEEPTVDRIVRLVHGKGERAARDTWTAVARARHNRDKVGAAETALDLLENYLKVGKNLTPEQAERWSGDYPLTVLDEAMKRFATRFGAPSAKGLSEAYPSKVSHRVALEGLMLDIGLKQVGFREVRQVMPDLLSARYSVPVPQSPNPSPPQPSPSPSPPQPAPSPSPPKPAAAQATNDPKSVITKLKAFVPRGPGREKLVTLLNEARTLTITKHPHSFCYLLRSMFEISAKAFCDDPANSGAPTYKNAKGDDRNLVDVLREIATGLTKNNADKDMVKKLHGATAELAKSNGFLSVTSMNQLVHNPSFTVDGSHISTLFNNIFPLLEAMN